jgi:proline dehydrogenase
LNPVRSLLLWASVNPWMRERFPRFPFVRRAVSRFMPGEEVKDALAASVEFEKQGISTILTLLGENVRDEAAAREVVLHYEGVLDEIRSAGLDAEVSVKLTHLGLDLGPSCASDLLFSLVEGAARRGTMVWVDMESSAYTQATIDVFRRVREKRANVGLCLQAYLRRTESDLEELVALGTAIRLTKGAYAEPRSIAFASKAEVDANFFRLSDRMLQPDAVRGGARIAIATHDRVLIRRIQEAAAARAVAREAYEFEMLYGIQASEQARLAAEGYRVRVLISYGAEWFPWYMRRLAERPANLWFVARNLFQQ